MTPYLPLSVYVPGNSPIHRLSPALKLAALLVIVIATTVLPSQPWHGGVALFILAVFYAIAGVPIGIALRQLAPVVPLIAFLSVFLWWQNGAAAAVTTALSLLAALAAANLLTLTTTIEALMDSLERALAPLARFGVPVDRISLAMSLTLRLIPLMLNTVNEALDARKARGAGFSLTAFGLPVVVRSIRRAQNVGDALMARGAGD